MGTKRINGTKSDLSDPEQSKRFLALARELGCDESEEAFEQTVRKIARRRHASAESDYIRDVYYEKTSDGVKFIGSRIIADGS
jgi:hypothetical protein